MVVVDVECEEKPVWLEFDDTDSDCDGEVINKYLPCDELARPFWSTEVEQGVEEFFNELQGFDMIKIFDSLES